MGGTDRSTSFEYGASRSHGNESGEYPHTGPGGDRQGWRPCHCTPVHSATPDWPTDDSDRPVELFPSRMDRTPIHLPRGNTRNGLADGATRSVVAHRIWRLQRSRRAIRRGAPDLVCQGACARPRGGAEERRSRSGTTARISGTTCGARIAEFHKVVLSSALLHGQCRKSPRRAQARARRGPILHTLRRCFNPDGSASAPVPRVVSS